ncbi:MAG: hypothetical protein H0W67_04535 [Gemmatimonadales bacterium]|nr:hypothetical protein [Gemmatimonadales bacterium]
MADDREVRLRPEFAHLYEGLEPGAWLRAKEWAVAVVDRARRARAASVHQRTFDPRHFEFRGGMPPRPANERDSRTRAGDQ